MLNKQFIFGLLVTLGEIIFSQQARGSNLPTGFVYLKNVAPTILQDMRYAGYHNFIGRPIAGYEAAECILTRQAAETLKQIQAELKQSSLSLKVYDCYRPQMAVDDFIAWSKQPAAQQMKAEFYPRVDKSEFFKLGYVAAKSGHTRGSTVDLTIVPVPTLQQANYHRGQKLVACFKPYQQRFQDNSIDMGTGFDCMDALAHGDNHTINLVAYQNRQLLRNVMVKYGMVPYPNEWWHFTLKDEPYPDTYFNFPVQADITANTVTHKE